MVLNLMMSRIKNKNGEFERNNQFEEFLADGINQFETVPKNAEKKGNRLKALKMEKRKSQKDLEDEADRIFLELFDEI